MIWKQRSIHSSPRKEEIIYMLTRVAYVIFLAILTGSSCNQEAPFVCHLSVGIMYNYLSNGKLKVPYIKKANKVYSDRNDVVQCNGAREFKVIHRNGDKFKLQENRKAGSTNHLLTIITSTTSIKSPKLVYLGHIQ